MNDITQEYFCNQFRKIIEQVLTKYQYALATKDIFDKIKYEMCYELQNFELKINPDDFNIDSTGFNFTKTGEQKLSSYPTEKELEIKKAQLLYKRLNNGNNNRN